MTTLGTFPRAYLLAFVSKIMGTRRNSDGRISVISKGGKLESNSRVERNYGLITRSHCPAAYIRDY